MDDVGSDQPFGNPDAFGIDLVQHQHFRFGRVANPLLALFVQMDVAQAVLSHDNLLLFVGHLAAPGADHDRAVVTAVKLLFAIAVLEQRGDDAVELPRRSGTGRIEVVPTDIDLERGLLVLRQKLLIVRQTHQTLVVIDDRGWSRFQYGDTRSRHRSSPLRSFHLNPDRKRRA